MPAEPRVATEAEPEAEPKAEADTKDETAPPGRERVVEGAVSWLTGHLRWFDPEQWARHLPPRGFAPSALLELLIVCRRLKGAGELPERAMALAGEVASRPSFGAGLHQSDAAFGHYVWLLALLWEAGCPEEPWRPVAQRIIDAECADLSRPGRSAAAKLEARYILDLAGLRHRQPAMAELIGQTAIGPGADPLQITDPDTYVITHVLFYLTDFGRRPLTCDEPERRRFRELVNVLLGRYLATGDLDLSAELLACSPLVGADERLVACAWDRLAAAQRPDGSMPSPLFRPDALAGLSGERAEAYEFGTCYHTTVATVLAATLAGARHD